MKKIDIHCHTTNRKIKNVVPESATIEAIFQEMQKHEIEKTVVLATYFPHKSSGISNFRLWNWIESKPEFCFFGSLDFEHYFYQGFNELEELAERKAIKGIKIYTCYQNIDLQGDKFKQVTQLAAQNSLPLMFHCGYSYASQRKYGTISVANLVKADDLEPLAQENPELKIIISHLSKPFIPELISVVKRNPNVYSDMSGLLDSKYEQKDIPNSIEQIKAFLGECGPSRLLFGTDFPVQTHQDSIFMLDQALQEYSLKDQEDVYYHNARKLLGWRD